MQLVPLGSRGLEQILPVLVSVLSSIVVTALTFPAASATVADCVERASFVTAWDGSQVSVEANNSVWRVIT